MPDRERIYRLLEGSSRTFALSIPRLPQPLRDQVALAYLVFRIADTIEDEGQARDDQRIEVLQKFQQCLNDEQCVEQLVSDWMADHAPDHEGYAQLLRSGGWVVDQLRELDPEASGNIRHYVGRTILGMIDRLQQHDPGPQGVPGIRSYCYSVAGIVGELCTELFILHHPPLKPDRERLLTLSVAFGEALQLVNILRDQYDDHRAGRQYLPGGVPPDQLLKLATQVNDQSQEYIAMLERRDSPAGILEFNKINLCLAAATLELLQEQGPGVKLSRKTVSQLIESCRS